jgi:phospholipase C
LEEIMTIHRRTLLRNGLLYSSAAAFLPPARIIPWRWFGLDPLPNPDQSGIEHIVVLTMENRSFDHLFGWFPNADGKQAGLAFVDASNVAQSTYSLSGDNTGCPHPDPDHSYNGARVEYDLGKMDGFLRAGSNDVFSIGYYGEQDIPFLANLARSYTTCDRYFVSILGPTFPNRLFLHAAQTDRLTDSIAFTSLPTIWDRLAAAGVSGRYYFNNVPVLALWGIKYLGITRTFDNFKSDAANGSLPAVAYLDPRFTTIDDGLGTDDHPHADIRRGDLFLHDAFEAVANGPDWSSTVFIITFDEWGGFFEHVPPPRATAANNVDTDLVDGKALLGFRVPTIIASPFTRGVENNPLINHLVFDHTSILKLIEWRWRLAPLTPRDASTDIANLAYALNFNQPVVSVPTLPKPYVPFFPEPCFQTLFSGIFSAETAAATTETSPAATQGSNATTNSPATSTPIQLWNQLGQRAIQQGFPVQNPTLDEP